MNTLRKMFYPSSFVIVVLGLTEYQFYRKWWGGHWELWWVDFPVCSEVWHDVSQCSLETQSRPVGLLRGTPRCEDYCPFNHRNCIDCAKCIECGRMWAQENFEVTK